MKVGCALNQISGLNISFEEKGNLIFGEGLVEIKPDIRTFAQMKPVLKDKDKVNLPDNTPLYFMYRDIRVKEDENLIRKNNLRYDITVITKQDLGEEYNKTLGHYHPMFNDKLSYPEIYEVLFGEATYILQKSFPPFNKVEEVVLIKALAGQQVVIPPNYGHITVNTGDTILVMANWMADNLKSIYEPFLQRQGGAVYLIQNSKFKIQNSKYNANFLIKELAQPQGKFAINLNKPMYLSFKENPETFKFLVEPKQ